MPLLVQVIFSFEQSNNLVSGVSPFDPKRSASPVNISSLYSLQVADVFST